MNTPTSLFQSLIRRPEHDLGRHAYQRDLCRGANPYRIGTYGYVAWQIGWDAAQDEKHRDLPI